MAVTIDDIRAARERIAGQVDRTPVRHSRRLSQLTGADVWVKYDNLHFTGSFKERGALNRLMQLTEDERKRGVVAA
ncbi:MAG: pyridoxal-phosphate dependent enzyme, partial [Brevundimonas sp.]